ncbi:hypothetical protein F3K43_00285 [Streptomyces sp. LBUM 1476]|nr:hypothetical protein [Streptomyces sp. LBUM 1476]
MPGVWTGVVRRNARGASAAAPEPRALAAAWTAGEAVDWRVLYEVPPPRVELPGYPFAGVRCWYGSAVAKEPEVVRVHEEFTLTSATPVIAGHRVAGRLLLPALAYIDLVHQAFRKQGFAYDSLELRDLTALRPLAVTAESPVRITLDAERTTPERWTIRIADQGGQPYATAELVSTGAVEFPALQRPAVPSASAVVQDLGAVYDRDAALGQVYSGAVRAGGKSGGTGSS